ncbi:hypothetical protein M404DRAFT_32001 [Pisolithus tinctorius Marx 270]|uniref:Uncharacterized protein n=1 Tax=Pisolithus tinctorius Marx 270 TaxID=870435 RepID=A0A0C3JJN3_PISTI|nr:hypothetical protein M404DRAFT_32001 [Pisolithus tinctorius Marx 270]
MTGEWYEISLYGWAENGVRAVVDDVVDDTQAIKHSNGCLLVCETTLCATYQQPESRVHLKSVLLSYKLITDGTTVADPSDVDIQAAHATVHKIMHTPDYVVPTSPQDVLQRDEWNTPTKHANPKGAPRT